MNGASYNNEIQNVFNNRDNRSWFIDTEQMIQRAFCFLYKKSPNIIPVIRAVRVNPGKYAPIGKSVAPRKSANAATIPA